MDTVASYLLMTRLHYNDYSFIDSKFKAKKRVTKSRDTVSLWRTNSELANICETPFVLQMKTRRMYWSFENFVTFYFYFIYDLPSIQNVLCRELKQEFNTTNTYHHSTCSAIYVLYLRYNFFIII